MPVSELFIVIQSTSVTKELRVLARTVKAATDCAIIQSPDRPPPILMMGSCTSNISPITGRVSAAARLLGLRVRIPPGRSVIQRSSTDCDVSLCVIQKPQNWGGPGTRWAVEPEGGNEPVYLIMYHLKGGSTAMGVPDVEDLRTRAFTCR